VVLVLLAGLLAAQALKDDDQPADPASTTQTSDAPNDDETPSSEPPPTPSETEPSDDGESDDVTVDRDSLLGRSYDDAADKLDELDLKARRVDQNSSQPEGTVIGVSPSGTVARGSTITLTVAREAPQTTAPTSAEPSSPATETPGGPGDDQGAKKP
jgi:serine/threonine-protein kinase